MAKVITKEDVVALMKKRQGDRTNKDFAEEIGISPQYLGDIYVGRREPGDMVLEALGLEKHVFYRKGERDGDSSAAD